MYTDRIRYNMAGTETRTIYWRINGVFRRIGTVDIQQARIVEVRIDRIVNNLKGEKCEDDEE